MQIGRHHRDLLQGPVVEVEGEPRQAPFVRGDERGRRADAALEQRLALEHESDRAAGDGDEGLHPRAPARSRAPYDGRGRDALTQHRRGDETALGEARRRGSEVEQPLGHGALRGASGALSEREPARDHDQVERPQRHAVKSGEGRKRAELQLERPLGRQLKELRGHRNTREERERHRVGRDPPLCRDRRGERGGVTRVAPPGRQVRRGGIGELEERHLVVEISGRVRGLGAWPRTTTCRIAPHAHSVCRARRCTIRR